MTARSAGAGDRRNDARERLSTERVGSAERSAGDGLIVDAADRVAGDISSICFLFYTWRTIPNNSSTLRRSAAIILVKHILSR